MQCNGEVRGRLLETWEGAGFRKSMEIIGVNERDPGRLEPRRYEHDLLQVCLKKVSVKLKTKTKKE